MIDPTYFKYLIELDTLIIHIVFFISNHCLDEIKDIFKRFISDKSSFVQKRESCSNSLILLSFKKREEEFDAESTSQRLSRKCCKFSLNFSVVKRQEKPAQNT